MDGSNDSVAAHFTKEDKTDMIGNIKEVKHVIQTKVNTTAAESEQKCSIINAV